MKKETDITLILDRSGSMESVRKPTIDGVNSFIEEQKKQPGAAVLTLVQFDDQYEVHYSGKPIAEVPALSAETYVPRGSTALYDAIGKTIAAIGERLSSVDEPVRPEKVVVVIQTDGFENASLEYGKTKVRSMIEHQRTKYAWQFVFIGADMDAMAVGEQFAIPSQSTFSYGKTAHGTARAFTSTSAAISSYRVGKSLEVQFDAKGDGTVPPPSNATNVEVV